MDVSKFKIVLTGKRNKETDIVRAAEVVANNFEITPNEVITLIKSRKETVLHKGLEHVKSYKIKRTIQDAGLEVRLEPSQLFLKDTQRTQKTSVKKKHFSLKNIFKRKIKNKHNKQEKPIKIDWDSTPSFKPIQVNSKPSSGNLFSNIIVIGVFGGVFWYLFTHLNSGSVDAYNDNGEPIVQVFTTPNCGAVCKHVIQDLKLRRVEFEHFNINTSDSDNPSTKKWKTIGLNTFPVTLAGNEKLLGDSKPQMATMLGQVFGSEYLTVTEKPLYAKHFDSNGKPSIAVYGAKWCGFCKKLKKDLNQAGIPYVYIDVDNLPNKEKAMKVMQIGGYPAVWVGYKRLKNTKFESVKSAFNNI